MTKYGKCHKCGGQVREEIMDHEYRIRGRIMMIFENVPVGVCLSCEEKVLDGGVARKIEDLALKKIPVDKASFVPVVPFRAAV